MESKICVCCDNELPNTTDYFYYKSKLMADGSRGLASKCRTCMGDYAKERRKTHKDYLKSKEEARRSSRTKGQAELLNYKTFIYDIGYKYDLTEQMFRDMMDDQNGCCAICKSSLVNPLYHRNDLHIDHDHADGSIRGLLCGSCNKMLGNARDKISIISEALSYLARQEEKKYGKAL